MIVLVTCQRRAPAFDRVGEEDGRPVIGDTVERLGQRFEALATEIVHQGVQFLVAALREQSRDVALIAKVVHQAFPPRGAALIGERGVVRIRTGLDPGLQRFCRRAPRRRPAAGAVTQHNDAPAESLEDRLDLFPEAFMHHPIEALAVIVDDPPGVAQLMLPAFLKAFIDIALVQLRIADEGDHAAKGTLFRPVLCSEIVLHDRGERRLRHAKADGARGEVHIVHVLGAAGIGLRAAIAAEALQLVQRLVAHDVLHRVEDRRGVRLHRHAVFGPQRVEIERGHDRNHRRAGGLVPAHFHITFALGAQVIGIVHHPG
jgi:hypothetical protein